MTDKDMVDLAKKSYELGDILADYQQTQRLMSLRQWDALHDHVANIVTKHRPEAALHNLTHPYMPQTEEEYGTNCLTFLRNLYAAKAAELGWDLTKKQI